MFFASIGSFLPTLNPTKLKQLTASICLLAILLGMLPSTPTGWISSARAADIGVQTIEAAQANDAPQAHRRSMGIAPQAAGDTISGVVFYDNNSDGADDGALEPGITGITVSAFDANGATVGSTVTNNSGQFTFVTSASGPYRVELGTLPAGLADGLRGVNSATTVQFVEDGGATNLSFGISSPAAYCQDSPDIATNVYFQANTVSGESTDASITLLDFPYSAIGSSYVPRKLGIPQGTIGTTWGLAYRRSTRTLYSAAYFKRFAPVGPNGMGAIYQVNRDPGTGSASLYTDLNSLFGVGTTGPDLHNFSIASDYSEVAAGVVTNTFDAVGKVGLGDLDIDDAETRLYVVNLFDRQLYEIPLDQTPTAANVRRTTIPLNQNLLPANACANPSKSIRPFALKYNQGALYVGMVCNGEGNPDNGERASWTDNNGDGRYNINEPYNDANGNGQFDFDFPDGLFAYVYRVNPTTLVFEPSPLISTTLTFNRGDVQGKTGPGDWSPWARVPTARVHSLLTYPQPILSDIEFDNGNLILGFRDRFGDQAGEKVHFFNNNATLYRASNGGDILRACGNPQSGWTMESNASCGGVTGFGSSNAQGPGGGEYYQDFFEKILVGDSDGIPNHQEIIVGGLANHSGRGEVIATVYDPVNFYSQGVRWFSNADGKEAKSYEVLVDPGTGFGKAAGIGDIELLCEPAPIEIGNRIWHDANQNGIQDPDEDPIAGVTVRLYTSSGALTGTAVTSADGFYYFTQRSDRAADNNLADEIGYVAGGLQPNTQVQLRLDNINNFVLQQGSLNGLNLTVANATGVVSGSDLNDSDATMVAASTGIVGDWPTIVYTTTTAGINNHTLDFGFSEDIHLSIGNQVWYDFDNNGQIDPTEKGTPGVTVDLFFDGNGNGLLEAGEQTPISSTTTSSNGFYLFSEGINGPLFAGKYAVGVNRSNFITGGVLLSYYSSGARMAVNGVITETVAPAPNNDFDNDDNGNKQSSAFYAGGVLSQLLDLSAAEPSQEASSNAQGTLAGGLTPLWSDPNADERSNLTVDFGFYQAGLGNRVILDVNNNEKREFLLEVGLNGITMTLWTSDGVTPVNIGPDGTLGTADDALGNSTLTRFDGFTGGLYEMRGLPDGDYIVRLLPPFTDQLPTGSDYPGLPARRMLSSNKNLPGVEQQVDPDLLYQNNDDNGFPDPNDPLNLFTSLPITVKASIGAESLPDRAQTLNTYDDFMLTIPIVADSYSLGNRVFVDLNNDGLFTPNSEPGIPGAILRLYNTQNVSTIQMTRTTDAFGFYRFDNLPAGNYIVGAIVPSGYASTNNGPGLDVGYGSANNPNNELDSADDGVRIGTATGITIVRSLTVTLGIGASEVITESDVPNDVVTPHGAPNDYSNLTVDFGFVLAQPLSLGNLVWDDVNNNGVLDAASEQGVANVELAIYLDTNGDKFIGSDERSVPYLTTTTTITGYYLFSNLPPASYEVELLAKNFTAGGPLQDYKTSTGTNASPTGPSENGALDPDTVTGDQQDKGRATTNTLVEPVIRTRTLDLSKDSEPLGEAPNNDLPGHPDADANLTVDFGVYKPLSLGNRVWLDIDNNANQDEAYIDWKSDPIPVGIPAVTLNLYASTNVITSVATAKTDLDGYYRFDNLTPGQYLVEVMAANFRPDAALSVPDEFVPINDQPDFSSDDIASTANPDGSLDKDDNGVGGIHDSALGIRSALVTLEYEGIEPVGESDLAASGQGNSDNRANMTVDFGFSEPVLIGNYLWYDRLNKGTPDDVSTGVPNVDVRVFLDADDDNLADSATPYSTTNTGASGYYTFFLKPGNWLLEFDLPVGFSSSTGQSGHAAWAHEGSAIPDPDDPVEVGGNLDQVDRGSLVPNSNKVRSKSVTVLPRTEVIEDVLDTNLNAYMGMDFGIIYPLSLGNLVWEDINNNGIVDASEAGIAAVIVNLYLDSDRDGKLSSSEIQSPFMTTTTSAQGFYNFIGLAAGDYMVELAAENFTNNAVLMGGQSSTGLSNSSTGPYEAAPDPNDDVNSDDNGSVTKDSINRKVVRSALIAIESDAVSGVGVEPTGDEDIDDGLDSGRRDADTNLTVDFGIYRPFSLGNRVWLDMDNNGRIDSNEPGLRGVEVTLFSITGTTPIASQLTDNGGYYRFDGLLAGDYRVVVPSSNITVTEEITGALVGLRSSRPDEAAPNSNGDNNDNGLGTSIDVIAGTNSDIVTVGPAADEPINEQDLAASGQGIVDNHANMTVDFGFYRPLALGDSVWFDLNNNGLPDPGEQPVANLPLVLWRSDGNGNPQTPVLTTTTDIHGCYVFTELAPIDYIVQIPASQFSANGQLVNYRPSEGRDTTPGDNARNDNTGAFAIGKGILSSRLPLTYTTQPLGEATCEPLPGYEDSNVNQTLDFGFYQLELGNRVWVDIEHNDQLDPSEKGLDGVQVELLDKNGTALITTTTSNSGYYSFSNLISDTYRVRITPPPTYYSCSSDATNPNNNSDNDDDGLGSDDGSITSSIITLTPGSEVVNDPSNGTSSNHTLDFCLEFAAIGDTVWLDVNGNGIQEPSELPLTNINVSLFTVGVPVSTTVTDEKGHYTFRPLDPGVYSLTFASPYNYVLTRQNAANGDDEDSDVDPFSHTTITTTLESGEDDPTWDAGYTYPASIGRYVWFDADRDGFFDSGEPPLTFISVTLYISESGQLRRIGTQLTDQQGEFFFDNLPPGEYLLRFRASGPSTFTLPGQDSDVDPEVGITQSVLLAPGDYKVLGAGYIAVPPLHIPTADGETVEPGNGQRVFLPMVSNQ